MPGNEVYPPAHHPLEHPRDPTSAHSPSSRSSSSPPSADKADRWSCTRDGLRSGKNSNRLYDDDKSAAGHTCAPRHESFDRNRERSNVLVSSRRPCAICPPSSPRARTYRRLSPPPCSLSLLSRCLTFFPLHHLILRPDPFAPARSLFLWREDFASRFDR